MRDEVVLEGRFSVVKICRNKPEIHRPILLFGHPRLYLLQTIKQLAMYSAETAVRHYRNDIAVS